MLDGTEHALSHRCVSSLAGRQECAGADCILVAERSADGSADFRCRVYDRDGKESGMPGCGLRSMVTFLHGSGLARRNAVRIETAGAVMMSEISQDGSVTVCMGSPSFAHDEIPFVAGQLSHLTRHCDTLWGIRAGGSNNWVSVLSVGGPFAVMIVGDADNARVREIGAEMERVPAFPQGVSVGFLQPVSRTRAKLRVWERSAGEVPASDAGACAAAVAGMRRGLFDAAVEILMPGETLSVLRDGGQEVTKPFTVSLTGRTETETKGEIELSDSI